MDITEFIPVGYKNRVSRQYLARATRTSDRFVRKAIESSEEPIISADGGYFIPGKNRTDQNLARVYYLQEKARIKSLQKKLKKYKKFDK